MPGPQHGSLCWSGDSVGAEGQLDPGHILKAESERFADGLDVKYEKTRDEQKSMVLGPEQQEEWRCPY